ncbi:MAG: hypothetical protein ACQXXJ_00630, partial [Candidatus Bathyarchaeia archaeon]
MQPVKFNGLLKEFIETPKNVELSTFIQQRLNLEKYKANALSEKIESALGITEIRELTLKKRNSVATA